MTAHSTARRRTRDWTAAVLIVFGMLGLSFGTWMSRLPSIRDHLDASTLDMSIYGFCLAIGSLTGLVLSGRIVSWLGPRRTLYLGVAAQAIALVAAVGLFWLSLDIAAMALLVGYGFCFGICDVAANVTAAGAERESQRPRMPLFHGAYSLGGVVSMGVGSLAEAVRFPVPAHTAIMLAIVVIATFAVLRWIPDDRAIVRASEEAVDPSSGSVLTGPPLTGPVPVVGPAPAAAYNPWRDPRIYLLGLIALAMSLAEGTGTDWIALAVVDGRGLSNSSGTLLAGVLLAAMLLIRLVGSPLLTRFGRVAVIRASAFVCAFGVAVLILVPFPWAPALGVACWGLGCGLGFPVAVSASADDPATAVKSVAAVSAIAYGAFLIGPVMIGFIGEHLGLLTAFWPLVAFMLVSTVIAGALRERKPGHPGGSSESSGAPSSPPSPASAG